jgi:hypothetical protein
MLSRMRMVICFTDPHSLSKRWKNFLNQVLNVHGVHNVRQMDIHTAEPLVLEPSLVKVEVAVWKLKSYKSPGTDQIPAELIEAGGETLYSEIHQIIRSVWKNCHSSGRNLFFYQFIKRVKTHQNSGQNQQVGTANESFENVDLGTTLTNQNDIHDEIKSILNSGNSCFSSVENLCVPVSYKKTKD